MQLLAGMYGTYRAGKEKNSHDAYGRGIYAYAERWADLMEEQLALGKTLPKVAAATSQHADTDGITGFMYGAAVSVLAVCWQHGEALRQWHNNEYDHDGEGVVNPAIVSF